MSGKHQHRKSDRMRDHVESFRVREGTLRADRMPLRLQYRNAVSRERGFVAYTCDSRLCACGKPALRTWKNVGYCKAHAPASVQ